MDRHQLGLRVVPPGPSAADGLTVWRPSVSTGCRSGAIGFGVGTLRTPGIIVATIGPDVMVTVSDRPPWVSWVMRPERADDTPASSGRPSPSAR